jgi:hypothetical protein
LHEGVRIHDSNPEAQLPVELREVSLCLSPHELDVVIGFLQHAKALFEASAPTPGHSHLHLKDWHRGRSPAEPDLIIVHNA